MVGFFILAFGKFCGKDDKDWFWRYASFLKTNLINPIFKIVLGRQLWNVVDVIWAITLFISIFIKRRT